MAKMHSLSSLFSVQVLSSEEAPSRTSTSRANGSLFDGSYLSLAATQARQPQVHRIAGGETGAVQSFSNPASLSCVSEFSPTDGPIKQHRSQKRECREPHSESHHRCEHCQGCGQDSGYGTQQRRIGNGSRLENGQLDTFNQHECERYSGTVYSHNLSSHMITLLSCSFNKCEDIKQIKCVFTHRLHSENAIGSEAKEALTRPLLGHEDWEEKRHQLLLQKMQLETERERLQLRLAEQEERLNRQNQQLLQSRLDYSRYNTEANEKLTVSGIMTN